jgi:hypothetical protein
MIMNASGLGCKLFQRTITMCAISTTVAAPSMIKVIGWRCAAKPSHCFNDIRGILKEDVSTLTELHLGYIINNLFFFFALPLYRNFLFFLRLSCTLTNTTKKGSEKVLNTTSFLNLAFKVRTESCYKLVAAITFDLLTVEMTRFVVVLDIGLIGVDLVLIFHTISIKEMIAANKLKVDGEA